MHAVHEHTAQQVRTGLGDGDRHEDGRCSHAVQAGGFHDAVVVKHQCGAQHGHQEIRDCVQPERTGPAHLVKRVVSLLRCVHRGSCTVGFKTVTFRLHPVEDAADRQHDQRHQCPQSNVSAAPLEDSDQAFYQQWEQCGRNCHAQAQDADSQAAAPDEPDVHGVHADQRECALTERPDQDEADEQAASAARSPAP